MIINSLLYVWEGLDLRIPYSHILIPSILPIVLNGILTSVVVVVLVGFGVFITNSMYYIFLYGPYLWSIYDIFFAYLAYVFLRSGG